MRMRNKFIFCEREAAEMGGQFQARGSWSPFLISGWGEEVTPRVAAALAAAFAVSGPCYLLRCVSVPPEVIYGSFPPRQCPDQMVRWNPSLKHSFFKAGSIFRWNETN